ncbi:MAG TPA: tetratricopeptide repeat protein, partial [Candidatus Polarisedimenticolaceae bacterium]|nr:tetratricopeptide repeat protein [Candidatus Polarisedimenticolaceae bacterium]
FLDEVSHRFMHFSEPRLAGVDAADVRRFGRAVERAYAYQDRLLGELLQAAAPETTVIVLADHGFLNGPDRPPGETADVEDKPGRWHRRFGAFVAAGPPIEPGRLAPVSLLDVAPTTLYLAGLPVPNDMDGRVLDELIRPEFRDRFPVTRIATYEIPPRATGVEHAAVSPAEREMIESLRSLGYIGGRSTDRPGGTLVTTHVNLAASLLGAGELERAEAEIEAALDIEADYPPARLLLFNLQYRQRRYDEAIATGVGLLDEPELPRGRFALRLARAYSAAGRRTEGVAMLKRRIADGQQRLAAVLAVLLYDERDLDGAERAARLALELDPLDEVAIDVIFDIARETNRVDRIEPLLEAALRRNPRSPAHLNYLSFVRERAGATDEAVRLLEHALEADPGDAATLANLGRIHLQQGRYDAAASLLERAVAASPSNVTARMHLGSALAGGGRLDDAIVVYEALAGDSPPTPPLCNALGQAHAAGGDLLRAAAWFRRSLELDPGQPEIRRRLSQVEARLE